MSVTKPRWFSKGVGVENIPTLQSIITYDKDELMILNKPNVRGDREPISGRPTLNAKIHSRVIEFAKTMNIPFEYESFPATPNSPPDTSQFRFAFKNVGGKHAIGVLENVYEGTDVLLMLPTEIDSSPFKLFLQECLKQVFREAVILVATNDVAEGRKMDKDIVNLAGGVHDDLAKLYTTTYIQLTEKKHTLVAPPKATGFMGLFGKQGGKTRKTKKSRSRKVKKTRKH